MGGGGGIIYLLCYFQRIPLVFSIFYLTRNNFYYLCVYHYSIINFITTLRKTIIVIKIPNYYYLWDFSFYFQLYQVFIKLTFLTSNFLLPLANILSLFPHFSLKFYQFPFLYLYFFIMNVLFIIIILIIDLVYIPKNSWVFIG